MIPEAGGCTWCDEQHEKVGEHLGATSATALSLSKIMVERTRLPGAYRFALWQARRTHSRSWAQSFFE